MNKSFLLVGLTVLILAGCSRLSKPAENTNTVNTFTSPEKTSQGMQVEDNMIYLATQPSGTKIAINTLTLKEPGYVVIHTVDDSGNPGAVIGHSTLLQGDNQQVVIELSSPVKEGDTLFAMLHSDDGNGVYEFPGNDKPVVGKLSPDPMGMVFEIRNSSDQDTSISL